MWKLEMSELDELDTFPRGCDPGSASHGTRPSCTELGLCCAGSRTWRGLHTTESRSCRRVWCSVCRAREGGQVQRAQGELHGEEEEEQGEEGHQDGSLMCSPAGTVCGQHLGVTAEEAQLCTGKLLISGLFGPCLSARRTVPGT